MHTNSRPHKEPVSSLSFYPRAKSCGHRRGRVAERQDRAPPSGLKGIHPAVLGEGWRGEGEEGWWALT